MSRPRSPIRITCAAISAFVLMVAFPVSAKQPNEAFFTKSELQDPGVINTSTNPVDWTKLKGVPGFLANGTDLATQAELDAHKASGDHDGRYYTETEADALFAAAGHDHDGVYSPAGHDHDGVYSPAGHDHDADYFTKPELQNAGVINTGTNPVDWTKLKNVPADIADGDDAGQPAWLLAGNDGTNPATAFLGTTDNQPLSFRVNSVRALRLEPDATSPRVIGGYSGNTALASGATIGGGGASGAPNVVTNEFGTVGGGRGNQAGHNVGASPFATVAGGEGNSATNFHSFVGGGWNNLANGQEGAVVGGLNNTASGGRCFVGGGSDNVANHTWCTVGGGQSNTASETRATVAGGGLNMASGMYSFVGGGFSNLAGNTEAVVVGGHDNTAGGIGATVGGGNTNTAGGTDATVAGGNANAAGALQATVGGGFSNEASGQRATVAGGDDNSAAHIAATVGGGFSNEATNQWATIGGGENNAAGGVRSTVGGGTTNAAGGPNSTIGGGNSNTASGISATVAGGVSNQATGGASVVGGGSTNVASGAGAMVPGGNLNTAAANRSFAAGWRANVSGAHHGAFLWSDSCGDLSGTATCPAAAVSDNFVSTAVDEFAVRSTGGARFVTAVDGDGVPTAGVSLAAGGTSWAVLSDEASKENFAPVDGGEVLGALAQVPIATWNAKSQDPSIRHIGPMAQDFHAAFGVGEDERRITTIDADGVALAAIQGLNTIVEEQETQILALEERIQALESGAPAPRTQGIGGTLFALIGALSTLVLGLGALLIRKNGGR